MPKSLRECVVFDGVRSANVQATRTKEGWFRHLTPDQILTAVYDGFFTRNPQLKPKDINALCCGCSHPTDIQFDIGRFVWLAGGFPAETATNTLTQMCPSGMTVTEHAARPIMCGEGDILILKICCGRSEYGLYSGKSGKALECTPEGSGKYGLLES